MIYNSLCKPVFLVLQDKLGIAQDLKFSIILYKGISWMGNNTGLDCSIVEFLDFFIHLKLKT